MDHATTAGASSTRMVDVLVPVALDQTYSYRVPRGMELKAGDVVAVPLGPREVLAVVWADNATPDPRLHNRLKEVGEKLDVPPLKPELRSLVDWVANYTLSPRGMVLRMCLRMGEQLGTERVRLGVRLSGPRIYHGSVADEPWLNGAARDPLAADVVGGLAIYVRAMTVLAGCLAFLTFI